MSHVRRSSRTNKGTHTKRADFDVYYKEDAAPAAKKQRLAADPDEGQVRCDPCNTTPATYDEETDEGGVMIACDGCSTWQHARCMGYASEKSIPAEYLCNRCDHSGPGATPDSETNMSETNLSETNLSETPESESEPVAAARRTGASTAATATTRKAPKPGKNSLRDKTRASVVKALLNVVIKADASLADAPRWAESVEEAIYAWSHTTDKKYIDKSRGVMALLKKPAVLQRLVSCELRPSDLTTLPVEEIDPDLKDYAEKVRQESIRRSVLTVEDSSSQRIRRTHKGEEIVEAVGGNSDFDEALVARNVDHRKFESTPPAEPAPASLPNPVAVYQMYDDDDDDHKEAAPKEASDDSDDDLDFILKPKTADAAPPPPRREPQQPPAAARPANVPPTMPTKFWTGDINFPDLAWFDCSAEFVSCTNYQKPRDNATASFHNRAMRVCKELLEQKSYQIEGRLDLARADPYLEKVASSRDFYVVKLRKGQSGDNHDKVFSYLLSNSKVGVLNNRAAFVKDAYVFAFDHQAPSYLQFAPVERGLYVLFVVKKDYVPVGRSILKKSAPPPPVATKSLDSILSKLETSIAQTPPPNPGLPQKPQLPQGYTQYHGGMPQSLPNGLNQDQVSYLSGVVQQNPQVQNNPQALLDLLQGMYR